MSPAPAIPHWTHQFLKALTLQAGLNTTTVLLGVAALGLAAGVVGTFTLLRRRALLSDALSHAGLPGVCAAFLIATALGYNARSLPLLLLGAAVFGALAVLAVHALTRVPRWKEDAAIGAALSVFFAFGVVLLSRIQTLDTGNVAGIQAFIFGQAAAISRADALAMAALAVAVVALAALAFKELRLACFDAPFAAVLGLRPAVADALILAAALLVTVLGLQAVGVVLIVALLIIPAAAARFWTERLPAMLAIAGLGGAVSAYTGAALSAAAPGLPTGPLIVCACGVWFAASLAFAPSRGLVARLRRRAAVARVIQRQNLLRTLLELAAERPDHAARHADLARARGWSDAATQRALAHARRAGEIRRTPDDAWTLTDLGAARAARIAHARNLWTLYLITHADVAPSHVDTSAEEVEHLLGPDLVAQLESALPPNAPARPA